mgnify:CR=1 FL=1
MKKILSISAFLLLFGMVAFAQSDVAPVNTSEPATAPVEGPKMTFETETIDYGTIVQGADPYRFFKFENTGTEPLVIKHAKGSCDCTYLSQGAYSSGRKCRN